jgi:quercetin dioxygenase-like cupin family protein
VTQAGDVPSGGVAFGGLPTSEPYPGVRRQSVSTAQATLTRYRFDPGASFPLHSHEQEQITVVEEGNVEMTIDGAPHSLGPGKWTVVAGNVPHGIVAGGDGARIVAIIVPRRDSPDEIKVEAGS